MSDILSDEGTAPVEEIDEDAAALAEMISEDNETDDDETDDDETEGSPNVTIPTDTVCFAGDVVKWGKLVPTELFDADAEPVSVLVFTPSDSVPLTKTQRKWRNLFAAFVKDSRVTVRRQEAQVRASKLEARLAKLRAELAKLEANEKDGGTVAESEASDGVQVIAAS